MALNLSGLFEGAGGGVAGGMMGQEQDPWAWAQAAAQQDPGTYVLQGNRDITAEDLGSYQQALEQAGLWRPEFSDYVNQVAQAGSNGGGDNQFTMPNAPDLSSLAGYQVGANRGPGYNVFQTVYGPNGEQAGQQSYERSSRGLDDYLQGAAFVGGSALGMNALFGGIGGAAAAGSEGLSLAGQYGGAGALGDASLLTGGSLGTVAAPAAGLSYGSAAGGIGMLGSLPEVPGAVASIPATGAAPATAATLPATAAPGAGGLLQSLTSNPRLIAGLAGGLLGGAGAEGGADAYSGPMPTITRGGWSPTATPTYMQPAPQPTLNRQPGQDNSGLWRFMGGNQ